MKNPEEDLGRFIDDLAAELRPELTAEVPADSDVDASVQGIYARLSERLDNPSAETLSSGVLHGSVRWQTRITRFADSDLVDMHERRRTSTGYIFINYRRVDAPLGATALAAVLAERFGPERVFRDTVSVEAGEIYPRALWEALEGASVLVAVIGSQWHTVAGPDGQPLIQREHDWVRREIAFALNQGIPVVPVLLIDTPDSATLPRADNLPDDIKRLAYLQALRVSQYRFGSDLENLTAELENLVPALAAPQVFTVPPPWQEGNAPSTLLRADREVVPFRGREAELADLRSWLTSSSKQSVQLIVGPGGSGKTRLAQEFCRQIAPQGWVAGVLGSRISATQLTHVVGVDKPLLMVVDDVEVRTDELAALGDAMTERPTANAPRRLLLLARSAGRWLSELQAHRNSRVAELFQTITERSTITLDTGISDRSAQFAAARAAFATALGLTNPSDGPLPELDQCGSLLAVHAAALNSFLDQGESVSDSKTVGQQTDPFSILLSHERRYWQALAEANGIDLDPAYLATASALATLCRPASEAQAQALWTRLPNFHGEDPYPVDIYVDVLRRLYPGPHDLTPLRPDLFGEQAVATTLAEQQSIVVTLAATCSNEQIINALTVLGRVLPQHPELATAIVGLIRVDADRLIRFGVDVVARLEDPLPFVRALGNAISESILNEHTIFKLSERLGSNVEWTLKPLRDALNRAQAGVYIQLETDEPS